jgi:adenylate cyclase
VDEVSAVRTAFAMPDALSSSNESRSDGERLTLNNRIDYFGRTVNIAARTQAVSGPGQLSMGEAFIRAPGVKEVLQGRVSRVKRGAVSMKGIDTPVQVYRVAMG